MAGKVWQSSPGCFYCRFQRRHLDLSYLRKYITILMHDIACIRQVLFYYYRNVQSPLNMA